MVEQRSSSRVLATGGSGFLGGFVLPLLVGEGYDVSALARSAPAAERVAGLGARPVPADLDDPSSVDAAFAAARADTLVSLASLGSGNAPSVVFAAEEAGIRRAIFVSTTAIFTSLPAGSKTTRVAAEETIRESGLDWTILRPTMIYGTPDDRNLWRLLQLLRRSPVVLLPGGGRSLQQPVHVADLASAVATTLRCPHTVGRVYDVAGPDPLTLRDLIAEASAAIRRSPLLVPVPLAPAVAALRLYERVARRPRLKAEQLQRLAEDKAFDIGPARRDLGFEPRAFADGIRQEAAHFR